MQSISTYARHWQIKAFSLAVLFQLFHWQILRERIEKQTSHHVLLRMDG